MSFFRGIFSVSCACILLNGCATVAVFEPGGSAEISLTAEQSELQTAAEHYCDLTLQDGLARGESSWGGLAGAILGRGDDRDAYWRRINAEQTPPAQVMSRIRTDVRRSTEALDGLNGLARQMLVATLPTRNDVAQFEKALIHARQARDSLSDAIMKVSSRSPRDYDLKTELGKLDSVLNEAASLADGLADARAGQAA